MISEVISGHLICKFSQGVCLKALLASACLCMLSSTLTGLLAPCTSWGLVPYALVSGNFTIIISLGQSLESYTSFYCVFGRVLQCFYVISTVRESLPSLWYCIMHAVYWHCMVAVCETLHWKKSLARSSHVYNCRFQVLRNNRQNLFNYFKISSNP